MNFTIEKSPQTERVLRGFRTDAHVRERLAGGGVLNIDRKLPYLFIYRQPPGRDDAGTDHLVVGEASYLITRQEDEQLPALLRALAATATTELGSFLMVELWAGPAGSRDFIVHAPGGGAAATADALEQALRAAVIGELAAGVTVRTTDDRHDPGMPPLLQASDCWDIGCLWLGLEVPPLYRAEETGAAYPVFLRRLRHLLSGALRQAAFEFTRVQTSAGFESHRALGPRRFGDAVTHVDSELAAIEQSYQLLLLLSPVNADEAWTRFRDGGFARAPEFRYRLLPVDPDVLKRRLFTLDLDAIGDPAMSFLLRDKRDELELQITMLAERNLPGFRYASIRLYGAVDDMLLRVAHDILESVTPPHDGAGECAVGAAEFAERARAELAFYRRTLPELDTDVQIRTDMMGLMVSRGDLLVSSRLALRPQRVEALLHHEVGTHVLTYLNGRAQPLCQLYTGLAGYDELQEGLAVFAEYLAGGLDKARMRLLAARVLAAHSVEHGADFVETFRLLLERGFRRGTAFDVAERVQQAGGFTRDLIYLRGLLQLVEYLRAGGSLEPLYVGKIAAKHVDIIDELRARDYLVAPRLLPRVLEQSDAAARLDAIRQGRTLLHMID
ncbi:MAG TPA: tyrosine/phenylalanine carboxypeptidase domain-containing protein [Longimicrobiales bacterium]|nr:tyrosine/phenylalanine carboxypeptidase domain-containing protein [Longimicrobiales bacterium]